jgi:hypothetical protein
LEGVASEKWLHESHGVFGDGGVGNFIANFRL